MAEYKYMAITSRFWVLIHGKSPDKFELWEFKTQKEKVDWLESVFGEIDSNCKLVEQSNVEVL